jgi:hypothetical protein
MNNLFLRRDDVPAAKNGIRANRAQKIAGNLQLRIDTAGIQNSAVF